MTIALTRGTTLPKWFSLSHSQIVTISFTRVNIHLITNVYITMSFKKLIIVISYTAVNISKKRVTFTISTT